MKRWKVSWIPILWLPVGGLWPWQHSSCANSVQCHLLRRRGGIQRSYHMWMSASRRTDREKFNRLAVHTLFHLQTIARSTINTAPQTSGNNNYSIQHSTWLWERSDNLHLGLIKPLLMPNILLKLQKGLFHIDYYQSKKKMMHDEAAPSESACLRLLQLCYRHHNAQDHYVGDTGPHVLLRILAVLIPFGDWFNSANNFGMGYLLNCDTQYVWLPRSGVVWSLDDLSLKPGRGRRSAY